MTVDDDQVGLEFRRIPFEAKELIRVYLESGRPFAEDAIAEYQSQD